MSFSSIFSANIWPNFNFRDSFGKLRTCSFQNCPWNWNLAKYLLRKVKKKTLGVKNNCKKTQFESKYMTSSSLFSANFWPNFNFRESFGKLGTCSFQNCPWCCNLTQIWLRYWAKTKSSNFCGHCVFERFYGCLRISLFRWTVEVTEM